MTGNRVDHRQPEYHAYLLRFWRDGDRQGWHATLQSTETGQRFHFGTLDELFAFLDDSLPTGDVERWPKSQPP